MSTCLHVACAYGLYPHSYPILIFLFLFFRYLLLIPSPYFFFNLPSPFLALRPLTNCIPQTQNLTRILFTAAHFTPHGKASTAPLLSSHPCAALFLSPYVLGTHDGSL
ncbi:hypothetical protein K445DRAFT_291679 [Daldinia sp. EC12]|nr:hypothetical protein K445DRAFT_291679 [Daldinia sp. EC12]